MQNITQTPENLDISLYVPRVESKYISAFRCYKIRHRYCVHVTFPWTAGIETKVAYTQPITEKECRDAVETTLFMNNKIIKVENDLWSTNLLLEAEKVEFINFFIIEGKAIRIKIIPDINTLLSCKYLNGYCKMMN